VAETEEEAPEEPTVAAGLVLQLRQLGLEALTLIVIGGGIHFGPLGPQERLLGGAGIHETGHAPSIAHQRPVWLSHRTR
jgi:hypothetical protein